jgi:hypothetical protein
MKPIRAFWFCIGVAVAFAGIVYHSGIAILVGLVIMIYAQDDRNER